MVGWGALPGGCGPAGQGGCDYLANEALNEGIAGGSELEVLLFSTFHQLIQRIHYCMEPLHIFARKITVWKIFESFTANL